MITNLIFDLSGYGGSANFTATTTTDLINELNTLTGVTWYWDPADCKPKSNFYPGVPPVITTAYKVSFVDIDNDSVGFCNAGSLDFTKFNEIDLSAYGGSATTAVTNNTDIINAFAALSLTVSVVGCKLRITNWDRSSTPSNIEVKKTGTTYTCFTRNLGTFAPCKVPLTGQAVISFRVTTPGPVVTDYTTGTISNIANAAQVITAINALGIPNIIGVNAIGAAPFNLLMSANDGSISNINFAGCPGSGCTPTLPGCNMNKVTGQSTPCA